MLLLHLRERFEKQLWTRILHHYGADRPAHQLPSDQKQTAIQIVWFTLITLVNTASLPICFMVVYYEADLSLISYINHIWDFMPRTWRVEIVSSEAGSWWFSNVDFLIKVPCEADLKRLEQYGWTSWRKIYENVFAFNSDICYSFILQYFYQNSGLKFQPSFFNYYFWLLLLKNK